MDLFSILAANFLAWLLISSPFEQEFDEDAKLCLKNKAKAVGFLGDDFGNDDRIDGICEEKFISSRKIIFKQIENDLKNDDDIDEKMKNCIMEKLSNTKIAENSLAIFFANETNEGDEDDELLIELKSNFNITMEVAFAICEGLQLPENFADVFYLRETTPYEKENPIKDVCMRRFIANNHLIPLRGFSMNLNPTKVEVSPSECSDYTNEHFKDYERRMVEDSLAFNFMKTRYPDRLNEGFKECLANVIKKEKFAERFLPLQYLPAYEFDSELKSELNIIIIETVRDYTEKMCTCVEIII